MSEKEHLWDIWIKKFLTEWFGGLMEGLDKVDEKTRKTILEMTGRACARSSASKLFEKTWKETNNVNDFLKKLEERLGEGIKYEKTGEKSISVIYPKCFCPLVNLGLVSSPHICNCSCNWLKENFEGSIGSKGSINVVLESSIVRGGKTCKFAITY